MLQPAALRQTLENTMSNDTRDTRDNPRSPTGWAPGRPDSTPVSQTQPTRQAVLPPSPAVKQTSTHPAFTGAMPGTDSMASFNAAAMRVVAQIQRPPASDRPGREVPLDRRG